MVQRLNRLGCASIEDLSHSGCTARDQELVLVGKLDRYNHILGNTDRH